MSAASETPWLDLAKESMAGKATNDKATNDKAVWGIVIATLWKGLVERNGLNASMAHFGDGHSLNVSAPVCPWLTGPGADAAMLYMLLESGKAIGAGRTLSELRELCNQLSEALKCEEVTAE